MRQLKAYPVGCFVEETLTSLKDAQSIVDCLEAENKRLMEEVGIVEDYKELTEKNDRYLNLLKEIHRMGCNNDASFETRVAYMTDWSRT